MSSKNNQHITIIKKVKKFHGGGHHGGAWKVAYADFVTAMMAFFLLLWLLSVSSEKTLKGISEYFTPTEAISDKSGLGFDGGTNPNLQDGVGTTHTAASSLIYGSPSKGHRVDEARESSSMSDVEKDHFLSLAKSLENNPEIQKFADNIHIDVTNEGLRIQITDSDNRPMFKPNTAELQSYMKSILKVIGSIVKDQPNYISISGHTASLKNPATASDVDFWQISSDRANEVRNFLTENSINDSQVVKIIGRSDREPFDSKDPYGVTNIRVAITLLNEKSVSSYEKSVPDKGL